MPDSSRRRATATLAVTALVLTHALTRPRVREAYGCGPSDGPDTSDAELTLLSWNLRNFPEPTHDRELVRARLDDVAPHVLALQEIHDASALAELIPDRELVLSDKGGAHDQHLGFATDDRVQLLAPPIEHPALALGGRVRPAMSSYLRTSSGLDFHLVVVHLKATPSGAPLRRLQWALLVDLVARLSVDGPGAGDPDILVVGDFNPTGDDTIGPDEERAALGEALAHVGLVALPIEGGCSAYWDGARHDGWLEPTLLDLVFVGGFAGRGPEAWRATPLGACAAHGCSALRSTTAHPDPQIAGLSDHCGVLVQLDEDAG